MPRIVNGQVVEDRPAKRETEKKRMYTWNDIRSNNVPSAHEKENTTRMRSQGTGKESEKAPVEETPAIPSVVGYLSSALHLTEYKLRIPTQNPVVVIDAAYFVLFLFFTVLFGYKMAVCVDRSVSCSLSLPSLSSFLNRSRIPLFVNKQSTVNDLCSSSLVGLLAQNLQPTDLLLRSLLLLLDALLQLVLHTVALLHHHEVLLSLLLLVRGASSLQLQLELLSSLHDLASSFLHFTRVSSPTSMLSFLFF